MVQRKGDSHFYVPAQVVIETIDLCSSLEFKTIVALARFNGMRIPSELSKFTWDRVNFPKKTMVIWDVKRKRDRKTPIFDQVFKLLRELWEANGEKSPYVISTANLRDPKKNHRTRLRKLIVRAGHKTWEKPFQNLRASCETDLMNAFPIHQVTEWIGNSPAVALRHYAMINEQDYVRAAENFAFSKNSENPEDPAKSMAS